MVQLVVHACLISKITRNSSDFEPSLRDCLEIENIYHKGLAIRGTWKIVS